MKRQAIRFFDSEEDLVQLSYTPNSRRGFLIESHIADLHFTAFDPKKQYEILEEQYLQRMEALPRLDVVSIDGDIFDHKIMSNSDGAMYASLFVDRLVNICRNKNAVLVIIHGTYQHDADQLKLFYHYMNDPTVDVRIVTTIQFEYIKGAKILCIPELYGVPEEVYRNFLFYSGIYDGVYMHGTIKGAIYGDNVGNGRLFTIEDFCKCRGPIISGHVHKSGCFNGYFYYTGTPYRYKHGEEEDKGYFIVIRDLDEGYHYVSFQTVESFRYITLDFDTLISTDPKVVIDYINRIKEEQHIDNLKIRYHVDVDGAIKTVINNYYRNNATVTVEFDNVLQQAEQQMIDAQNEEYSFILNSKYTDEEKFVMYCNAKEGYEFITVEKLIEILEDV